MIEKTNSHRAAFINLLQTSIEIPLRPGSEIVLHEIVEQAERAAIITIQVYIVIGKTEEDACKATLGMLKEYMQDAKRAKYADILFGALPEFVAELWEVHVNSFESTREFPVMFSSPQN